MPFPPRIADMLLNMPRVRASFLARVTSECRRLSQKRNKLAVHEAFMLKAGGASRNSLQRSSSLACMLSLLLIRHSVGLS